MIILSKARFTLQPLTWVKLNLSSTRVEPNIIFVALITKCSENAKLGLPKVNVATHALRGGRNTNATLRIAGTNDQNLLFGMASSRQVFSLKIVTMLVCQILKLTR